MSAVAVATALAALRERTGRQRGGRSVFNPQEGGEFPTVFNTRTITVFGLAGDDKLRLDETNGPLPGAQLYGGTGTDAISGGSGADSRFGGAGDDTVDGDRGDDSIALGDGNDLAIWDPGDGSDRLEEEGGFDTFEFSGSGADERFDLSPDGARARLTRTVGAVAIDAATVERVDVDALGGDDALTLDDLSGTAVQELRTDLEAVRGGACPTARTTG